MAPIPITAAMCGLLLASCASRKETGALNGAGTAPPTGPAAETVIAGQYDSRTAPPQQGRPRFPTAKPTERRGYVWSPYPPHRPIDVRGFRSGEVAVDPTTDQPFIAP